MPRMLITGASGFIGQAMCKAAAQAGFHVVAAYRSPPLPLKEPLNFERRQMSDYGSADCQQVLAGCDIIIHLAGRAHRTGEALYEALEEHHAVNTQGTLQLCRQAIKAGVKRFVFVSSIGVNGMFTLPGQVFREDDVPNPHSAYALSKLEAELGLKDIARKSPIDIVIVRPPLVYGPHAPGNFALLVRLVASGLPLPFAAIENRRSFIGIDNLTNMLIACATHPQAAQQIFLASDGEDISTIELVRQVASAMHKTVRLWPLPPYVLEAAARIAGRGSVGKALCSSLCVDASHARYLLGWQPPVPLAEGLRRAVQGYEEISKDSHHQ